MKPSMVVVELAFFVHLVFKSASVSALKLGKEDHQRVMNFTSDLGGGVIGAGKWLDLAEGFKGISAFKLAEYAHKEGLAVVLDDTYRELAGTLGRNAKTNPKVLALFAETSEETSNKDEQSGKQQSGEFTSSNFREPTK